ncbi:MAG: hypothetical protein SOZ59_12575 [Candidatus Limivivens sp.]|nr:hypothetical protein [Candidatus Limivivens sp.]
MKILERIESRERCAESGWYAYDYILDGPMDPEFIRSLRPLGSFVYLTMLAKPFFKIESDYFLIKGLEGDSFFRMAVHDDHHEKLAEVEAFLEEKEEQRLSILTVKIEF